MLKASPPSTLGNREWGRRLCICMLPLPPPGCVSPFAKYTSEIKEGVKVFFRNYWSARAFSCRLGTCVSIVPSSHGRRGPGVCSRTVHQGEGASFSSLRLLKITRGIEGSIALPFPSVSVLTCTVLSYKVFAGRKRCWNGRRKKHHTCRRSLFRLVTSRDRSRRSRTRKEALKDVPTPIAPSRSPTKKRKRKKAQGRELLPIPGKC